MQDFLDSLNYLENGFYLLEINKFNSYTYASFCNCVGVIALKIYIEQYSRLRVFPPKIFVVVIFAVCGLCLKHTYLYIMVEY